MDPKTLSNLIDQARKGILHACDTDSLVRLGVVPAVVARLHPVPEGVYSYDWYTERGLIKDDINDADWLSLALHCIPADMSEDDAIKLIMTASGGRQSPSAAREAIKRSRVSAPYDYWMRTPNNGAEHFLITGEVGSGKPVSLHNLEHGPENGPSSNLN